MSDSSVPHFVLLEGQAKGPFSRDDVRLLIEDATVTAKTMVWNETMENWLPLHQVAALADLAQVKNRGFAYFGRRFLAGFIDLLVICIVFELLAGLIPPFRVWIETAAEGGGKDFIICNIVLSTAVSAYYLALFSEWGGGATLGYRATKLQLLSEKTRRPTSFLKVFLWCFGSFLLPIGWIWYFFDPKRRMLHNMVSQTVVIKRVPL